MHFELQRRSTFFRNAYTHIKSVISSWFAPERIPVAIVKAICERNNQPSVIFPIPYATSQIHTQLWWFSYNPIFLFIIIQKKIMKNNSENYFSHRHPNYGSHCSSSKSVLAHSTIHIWLKMNFMHADYAPIRWRFNWPITGGRLP